MYTNIYVLVFVICSKIPTSLGQTPPQLLPWYDWANRLMVFKFINMTAEILHDTTIKVKQALKIKDMHKHSITYELGMISAGIQERFQRMLKIYRSYANFKDFHGSKYTLQQNLYAYHVIQGEYNEIRLEKSLFYEIKKKHESTTTTTNKYIIKGLNPKKLKQKGPKGPNNRRKWSPKEEQFYNFPTS